MMLLCWLSCLRYRCINTAFVCETALLSDCTSKDWRRGRGRRLSWHGFPGCCWHNPGKKKKRKHTFFTGSVTSSWQKAVESSDSIRATIRAQIQCGFSCIYTGPFETFGCRNYKNPALWNRGIGVKEQKTEQWASETKDKLLFCFVRPETCERCRPDCEGICLTDWVSTVRQTKTQPLDFLIISTAGSAANWALGGYQNSVLQGHTLG